MIPFPLSEADRQQFIPDVGISYLWALPSWGGIAQWHGRYILVYLRPDGVYALTDISGGIPDSGAPGGVIPVEAIIHNMPTTQTSSVGVFLYSLPANFIESAKEFLRGAHDVIAPVIPDLSLIALLGIIGLIVIYAPRPSR